MRTLVWDVDDVLNDLMRAWFVEAWRPAHPATRLAYEDLVENPPHRLLGVSLETYLASLDAYRASPAGSGLPPDAAVLAWFRRHGAAYRHLALTSTPRAHAPQAAAWVLHHFGDWIRTVSFVPSLRAGEALPAYDGSKAGFLRWLGRGDMLVEDNPEAVRKASALGLGTILVPRPWNRGRVPLVASLEALVGPDAAAARPAGREPALP
jgi:FMN phosphatase YigB (HAD superfamily)